MVVVNFSKIFNYFAQFAVLQEAGWNASNDVGVVLLLSNLLAVAT